VSVAETFSPQVRDKENPFYIQNMKSIMKADIARQRLGFFHAGFY
jgi:hypothetical protein